MKVDQWDGLTRGVCPRCGSSDVVALLIGELIGPLPGKPDWVELVGCLHPGFDHRCESCSHIWEEANGNMPA